jgi:1-acyl-sn-glycerol-3-phosphate acyltransferase
MAGKKRGLMETVRSVFLIVWVFISVVAFGTVCLAIAPVNNALSRSIALLWMRLLLCIGGVRVEVRGMEHLKKNGRYVFIANHQSHLDIPVLFAALRFPLSFIAKKELFRIPFFGWGMYSQGHIWIDRENARKAHASIKRAVTRLQKDNFSLVLFPEGTRSSDGVIGQFKQGSFSLAQQAGAEVVPIAIRNTSRLLPKYSWIVSAGTARLIVGKPIAIDETMSKAVISEQVHAAIQKLIDSDIG